MDDDVPVILVPFEIICSRVLWWSKLRLQRLHITEHHMQWTRRSCQVLPRLVWSVWLVSLYVTQAQCYNLQIVYYNLWSWIPLCEITRMYMCLWFAKILSDTMLILLLDLFLFLYIIIITVCMAYWLLHRY